MASISRNIATISRFPAIRHNSQAYRALQVRPSTSSANERYDNGHPWPASSIRQPLKGYQTRHATTFSRSRETTFSPVGWTSYRTTLDYESRRYLSTTLRTQYAGRQDGGKESTSISSKPQTTQQPPDDKVTANTDEATSADSAASSLLKSIPLKVPATPKILHENIYTLPNLLTTTRIVTAPMISYALLHSQPVLAFVLFAYSSITDLIDGYLARHFGSSTVLGSILDPFADKLLMTLTTITLYYIGTFPWWLALTILGRDGGLLLSALYFRWISLPEPRTMVRYWDFSLPSAEVRPTEISKINTMLQFLLVAGAVGLPVVPEGVVEAWNLGGILEGWMGLVAGTTIWSGLSYVFTRDAIRFIGRDGEGEGEKKDVGEEQRK